MKLFKCQECEQVLFFENTKCERCLHCLGYLPEQATLSALEPDGELWRPMSAPDTARRFCANREYDACNWLVAPESAETLCDACRHNRTIPDLKMAANLTRWRKFEVAKHRLFYTLIRLRLPTDGMAFNFLADIPGAPRVMTGHENGLITINLIEADDAEREKIRQGVYEPYRTLLGHFRHESGHYYWERLVQDAGRIDSFRELFGDERAGYVQALQANYSRGPGEGWRENHLSSYAASHPWEDFAETWAHYLHIVDTLEMAFALSVRVRPKVAKQAEGNVMTLDAEHADFDPHEAPNANALINAWLPLTFAVNSINRCMGEPDLYPFVLSPAVMRKIGYVHELVRGAAAIALRA